MNNKIKTIVNGLKNYIDSKAFSSRGDWNQNDKSAENYIKNRPFYEEDNQMKFYLNETTIDGISESGEFYQVWFEEGIKLDEPVILGETYTISYDGVEYSATPQQEEGGSYFGIDYYSPGENPDNLPFGIWLDTNWDDETDKRYATQIQCVFTNSSTSASHTLAIYKIGSVIHQIDPKYLPSDLLATVKMTKDSKMNKYNPTGTGSFSMNRKAGTTVGTYSHAEGYNTTASGNSSHAEGSGTTASRYSSHAEGQLTTASGQSSHAEGYKTTASGEGSHAEGYGTKATKTDDTILIRTITDKGYYTHAEGYGTVAYGAVSHAEGNGTKASGTNSHSEGNNTTASGDYSHAEGRDTWASGDYSHAGGYDTTASGYTSHSEGNMTTASGYASHSEGNNTTAYGSNSHAEGWKTKASGESQHVQGQWNIDDVDADGQPLNTYAHIVGNGESDGNRSNAHTLDWDGNAWFAGTVEGTALILSSPNGTRFNITVGDDGVLSATEITE